MKQAEKFSPGLDSGLILINKQNLDSQVDVWSQVTWQDTRGGGRGWQLIRKQERFMVFWTTQYVCHCVGNKVINLWHHLSPRGTLVCDVGLKIEMRTIGYKTPPWELSTLCRKGHVVVINNNILHSSIRGHKEGKVSKIFTKYRKHDDPTIVLCRLKVSLIKVNPANLWKNLRLFPIICSKCSMKLLTQSPTDGQYVNETRTNGKWQRDCGWVRACGDWINQLGDISLNEGQDPPPPAR